MTFIGSYTFNKPESTDSVAKFIACQNSTTPSYYNFSFKDEIYYKYINRWLRYCSYNVISDYVDDIRKDYCSNVSLSDSEFIKYKYKPKLLAYDIYNNAELGTLILIINDMYSVRQFSKKKILLPSRNGMNQICKYIYNANNVAITAYNS